MFLLPEKRRRNSRFVLDPEIKTFVEDLIGEGIAKRLALAKERNTAIDELKNKAEEALKEKLGEDAYNPAQLSMAMEELQEVAYRAPILATGERSGGRGPNELRTEEPRDSYHAFMDLLFFPEAKLKPSCSLLSDRPMKLNVWTASLVARNQNRLCFTTPLRFPLVKREDSIHRTTGNGQGALAELRYPLCPPGPFCLYDTDSIRSHGIQRFHPDGFYLRWPLALMDAGKQS